ncbi:MAG: aspartate kinase [Bacillota bacterium]|nr:MAG: aspartate kinase [Bacillota bacterium]
MKKVKVSKFGGTSMATAETIKKVVNIIKSDEERKYIVVSAPGKRFTDDVKITDMLYQLADEIMHRHTTTSYAPIKERFLEIANGLNLSFSMNDLLDHVLVEMLEDETLEFIVSRGEYLSAIILADVLGYEFVDAKDLVRFKGSKLDYQLTHKTARKVLKTKEHAVISGFYGANIRGDIKILPRGGADVSGALVARAVMAKVYENWTDRDGFLMCDPRIVENPHLIDMMTYRELRALSFMGASVLHSDTFYPVQKEGIPINARNTFNPSCPGTFIYDYVPASKSKNVITGIAGLNNFTLIIIEKHLMNEVPGFDRRILSFCEKLDISVEHFPSGTDTFSMMIESKYLVEDKKEILINQIKKTMKPDNVEVLDNISLISIVGRNLMANKYNMLKLFSALVNTNITLRMIDYGSNGTNIVIGVDDIDYEYAINAVYNEFIREDHER